MTLELTFDDGPSEWTPQILDLLAEFVVQATFFVIGQHIEGNEGILLRADYEGHAIGNHTWSHPRLTGPAMTSNTIRRELKDTSAKIADVTGTWPAAWRAPYYAADGRALSIAADLGLTRHVGSDIVPDDWMLDDAEEIARRVLRDNDGIVTLHDGIPPGGGSARCTSSRQPTVDAVRLILEATA